MRSAFSPLAREAVPPRDSIPPMPRSLAAPQLLLLLGAGHALPGSCQPPGTLVCALRCEIRGVYPGKAQTNAPGASYEGAATATGRRDGGSDARGARLARPGPVVADAESCRRAHRKMSANGPGRGPPRCIPRGLV